jgi:hypothetical protein
MLKTNEEEAKDIRKPVKPFKILDIDLDFFLENIHYGSMADGNLRVSSDKYKPWPKKRVVQFLETRCGLVPGQKIDGAYFVHHRKLFHIMTRFQDISKETLSFSIDHIDGHADLGAGDDCLVYICTNLLFHPPEKRSFLEHRGMKDNLGSGNFLAFAIACRLIGKLNFITHPGKGRDTPTLIFKNYDKNSHVIQLKKFDINLMEETVEDPDDLRKFKPVGMEPEVPFRVIPYNEFQSSGGYDFVFLAQSPSFTPVESDRLIPVISKYMNSIMGDQTH